MRQSKKIHKIAYVTGTRAEFGYMKQSLQELNHLSEVEVVIIATGMHTASGFGKTISEVKSSGLRVIAIADGNDGKTLESMAVSVAKNLSLIVPLLSIEKPQLLIIEGDRGEQLAAGLAASYLNIPILHRGGGNTSGNIDNKIRSALTAIADYHFPSNREIGKILAARGIPKKNIYNIGGPVPDMIMQKEYLAEKSCREKYNLTEGPLLVLVFHPVTEENGNGKEQIREILKAIKIFKYQTIAIGSNSDAEGRYINEVLKSFEKETPFLQFYTHIPRYDYLGLLNVADLLIGNTSSGFSELPSFKKPYILVGNRQHKRFGEKRHILNVRPEYTSISQAIKRALTDKTFRRNLRFLRNPYGNGDFYKQFPKAVLSILKTLPE